MSNAKDRPLVLVILDGWGHSDIPNGNALSIAHTPFYDQVRFSFPGTTLVSSGTRVGLSDGIAAGPEVGHLNIGTGRVVVSDAERVAAAVRSGCLENNEVLREACSKVSASGRSLHLIGLVSDSTVNSSLETVHALLRTAKRRGVSSAHIHCILDGRDAGVGTAENSLARLEAVIASAGIGRISTLCGRYFAMDTGGNWERTARTFTMLVHGEGDRTSDPRQAVRSAFERGITEEFLPPAITNTSVSPAASVADGDTVIFFNHKAEGMKQLVRSLSAAAPNSEDRHRLNILCLTDYDSSLDVQVILPQDEQANVLSKVLSDAQIANCRITESERTPHLTYFLDGGTYHSNPGEREFLIPSPGPEKYSNQPEMSSFKVADCVRRQMRDHSGVFIVNLPAADVISQTGDLERTVESIQYVDTCLGGIMEAVKESGGVALITSSHSNCENLLSGESNPNPVPFHLVDHNNGITSLRKDGALEDVAPTILAMLGIEKPSEMTGTDLRI